MAKLATEFLENTTPNPTGGFLIFNPVTGLRERLTIGQFFSRFGITVGVGAVGIPQLTGDILIIGDVSADNLSGTNTGDQDISGIAVNAGEINNLEVEQNSQSIQIQALQTGQGSQDIDIATNAGAINTIEGEQVLQDQAIALNTAKDISNMAVTNADNNFSESQTIQANLDIKAQINVAITRVLKANGDEVGYMGNGSGTDFIMQFVNSLAGTSLTLTEAGDYVFSSVPIIDPLSVGAIWNNNGVLNISSGV